MNTRHYNQNLGCEIKVKALRPKWFIARFWRREKMVTIINLHGLQIVSRSWQRGIEIVLPWQPGKGVWR